MGTRTLGLCAALLAGAAWADNTADEADVAFTLGNRDYAKGDYQNALSQYFLSNRLVPNRNVLFNIARCYEALKSYDEAYRYYNDLLSAGVAGEDKAEADQALARLRGKVALLLVVTVPAGADVFVDRVDLGSRGRSPQALALTPGKHKVFTKLEGYLPADGAATVERGHEATVKLTLPQLVGTLNLTGTAGAQLRDSPDGPVVARVPGAYQFSPGKHIFYAGAPGFVTAPFLVDISAEAPADLSVKLTAQPKPGGKLVVTANRENALITVDGKEAGFAPAVVQLPEGDYEVEVSYKDLRPYRQRVTIVKDQETKLAAELRYAPPPVQAASKRLLSVDEAPASVTVITLEEIRAFGYTTLPQALSAVRGLYTADDRQYSYVGVRGFSPPGDYNTRVLILWDGHAVNDVWAGQGYLGRELVPDLEEVDHIEVVRGPASALYGTGAFFAVINIVTRQSLGKNNAEGTAGVSSLDASAGHLAAGFASGNTSVIASGSAYSAAGAQTTNLALAGGSTSALPLVIGLDGEHALNGQARVRWGDFSLSVFLNSRAKNLPTAQFGTTPGLSGTHIVDSRGFAELRFDHEFSAGAVSARAFYDGSRYAGQWNYGTDELDPAPEYDSGGADWVGGELRGRYRIFSGNQLTLGLDSQIQLRVYQTALGGPYDTPPASRTRNIIAAYVFDDWQIISRLYLNAALRVDNYSDISTPLLTPRGALVAKPYKGGLTKLVVGEAFRAPNVYESFYDDNGQSQIAACQLGKPCNLKSETIFTAELEHSHDLTEELRITVAGYYNRIRNLVVLDNDPAGTPCVSGTCLVYQNTPGVLQATGAEAEVRWQPGRFALVDVSYSYVRLSGAGADFSSILAGAPAHLAAARVMLPLVDPYVRIALSGTYQSARQVVDSGAISNPVGAAAGEALLIGGGISGELEHLRYFVGVANLLDAQYVLPISNDYAETGNAPPVPQYGRTFTLRVSGTY